MIYQVKVMETHSIEATYEVEADSPAEARELAEKGETVSEDRARNGEVVRRLVCGNPVELPPPKAWLVVLDFRGSDPLKNAIVQLRVAVLTREAAGAGLEVETAYGDSCTKHVVVCTPIQAYDLVKRLDSAGCVDFHLFTKDDVVADLVESSYAGLFRVCRSEYRRTTAGETE